MKKISLGPSLFVNPAEAATQVIAALGMRGSGKSNIMAVLVEGMLSSKVQVVVLDYVGIWFSLRLQPNGKTPSDFEIPILGGSHGDVAIEAGGGAVVARALATSSSSAVLDVSSFSKSDRCRFATDFAETFFHEKKRHPGPCFLLLEEAQRFVPQKIFRGQERMLGAFEEIAEVGRNYGIGLGMMSQRPQKISKDVLNLTELLFAFQANGVHERRAIAEWVQEKDAAGREDVHGELPGLAVGEALVWSPRWLEIYGHHTFRKKSTYDAGATPIKTRSRVKTRPLDLDELRESMVEVVDAAEKDDPRILRHEIDRLKRELSKKVPATAVIPKAALETNASYAQIGGLSRILDSSIEAAKDAISRSLEGARLKLGKEISRLSSKPGAVFKVRTNSLYGKLGKGLPDVPESSAVKVEFKTLNSFSRFPIARGERKVLIAVAQHDGDGVTREQLTVLTGYKRSTRDAYIYRLTVAGLIDSSGSSIVATPSGISALGNDFEPLPTGDALRDYHLQRLPEGERRVLEILVEHFPRSIAREEIDARTDYKRSSRDAYLHRLTARKLVEASGRGEVRASSTLFS